jgi:CHAT domain-containing protein
MRLASLVLATLLAIAPIAVQAAQTTEQLIKAGETSLRNNALTTAEQEFQKAYQQARSQNDRTLQQKALSRLGQVYYQTEQFSRAISTYQIALGLGGTQEQQGELLSLRGFAHLALGEYQQAYTALSQAQGKQLSNLEAETLTRIGLGEACRYLGLYSKALEHLQMAQKLARSQAENARVAHAIAEVRFALGQYREAQQEYETALQLRRRAGDQVGAAETLQRLGRVKHVSKAFTAAEKLYEEALLNLKGANTNARKASILNDLGVLYAAQGKMDKAKTTLEEALNMSRLGGNAGRIQALLNLGALYRQMNQANPAIALLEEALALARRNGDKPSETKALSELGETYLKFKKPAQAVPVLKSSIDIFESLRPGLLDADKVALFETHLQTYRNLQTALVRQQQPEAALAIAERSRARAFVELLANRLSDSPRLPKPPSLKEIQAIAQQKQVTLVTYSIAYGTDQQESALYTWVVKPTGEVNFRQVNLKALQQDNNVSLSEIAQKSRLVASIGTDYIPTELDRVVVSMRGKFRASKASTDNAPILASVQSAYQILIQPIADLLPKDPQARVVFIPQGALLMVPFAALQDASGKFLIEKHTLSVAPSIQALTLTKSQARNAANALVIGNPTPMPQELSPLPGAEAEAKAIAQLLKTKPIVGSQATKSAVLDRISNASLIHFATHGLLEEQQALQSSLALAGSVLTADEILNLRLKADLAVLSACDTGRGKITGDGVIGLSRSLMSAGVPSVVVSLWMVPDEATSVLMTEFYRNLQSNPDKAQSLRQAMLTTMKKFPNPRDWAGFMLVGRAD